MPGPRLAEAAKPRADSSKEALARGRSINEAKRMAPFGPAVALVLPAHPKIEFKLTFKIMLAAGVAYLKRETRSAFSSMTLALSAAAVPVGSPLYRTLGFDQNGMRGQPPQL